MPIKTEHRLSVLETNYSTLNDKVDEIMTNHLVHIQAAVDKVQEKQDRGQWLLITTLVGLVIVLTMLWFK